YLTGAKMVAHNEKFDREVLMKTMNLFGLDYKELNLPPIWECTSKIYRAKGFKKTKLSICCNIMGIELNHHDPLSDAKASAQLFMNQDKVTKDLVERHFPIEGQVAS
ncbi:MAG: 3'-5' exonuclease, partial [Sphingobacterium sp.]